MLTDLFIGRSRCSQHGVAASRVRASAEDAERLRLYVQAGMAEREMQSASLKKIELACRRLELQARESIERTIWAEAERDETCHEAIMAKLATEGAVNTRAQIEFELARVQRAFALMKEAHQKA